MIPLHGRRQRGERTLTLETFSALIRSINGFISLTKHLLQNGYSYVLLGRHTSDPIEKLFGIWRQSSGANYYLSVADIVYTNRIKWSQIVNCYIEQLPQRSNSYHFWNLCTSEPTECFEFDPQVSKPSLKYPAPSVVTFVLNCQHVFENLPPMKWVCQNFIIQCFEIMNEILAHILIMKQCTER